MSRNQKLFQCKIKIANIMTPQQTPMNPNKTRKASIPQQ